MKLISTMLVASCVMALHAMALEQIGNVSELDGLATALQRGAPAKRVLQKGAPVYLNDTVQTAKGGKLQILFRDGSTIRQGESSELVIDQYVFNPAVKKENAASFRVTRGIIRVITDKITRLNPDRFKVSTNYGTIGIRGCDLMFDVKPNLEKVIVVELHHADSVVVDMNIPAGPNSPAIQEQTVVRNGGRMVQMSLVNGMNTANAVMNELEAIDNATQPAGGAEKEAIEAAPAPRQAAAKAAAVQDESSDSVRASTANAQQQLAQAPPAAPVEITPEPAKAVVVAEATKAEPVKEPAVVEEESKPVVTKVKEKVPAVVEPSKSYPIVGARTSTTLGSGTDWSWGAWEQEITDLDTLGEEVTFTDRGTFTAGNTITGDAFRSIRDGAAIHNLSGTGTAGAAIVGNQQSDLVTGTSQVNVLVGGSVAPTWNADVAMSGGTSALTFKTSGSIDNNGALNGSLDSYNLNAFGKTEGNPTSQKIKGNLVGSGTGAAPVSGAVGTFKFNHSGGPKVDGAFGADLSK